MPAYHFDISPSPKDGFKGVYPRLTIKVNTGDADKKTFLAWLKREKDNIAEAITKQLPSWLQD